MNFRSILCMELYISIPKILTKNCFFAKNNIPPNLSLAVIEDAVKIIRIPVAISREITNEKWVGL